MSRSRSIAGTSPKSSSAAGRSSTASRRTSCRVETTSSRSSATAARSSSLVGAILERLQAEEDRRQRLAGLVVELACEARTLELLRLDDAANGVAADSLGELDRGRRPRRERLGEPDVLVGEARRRAELVVRDDDADRATLDDERDVQGRANAHAASDLLVDLGIVEHGVDALAASRAGARVPSWSHRARARSPPDRRRRTPSPSAAAIRRRSRPPSGRAMSTRRALTRLAEPSCDQRRGAARARARRRARPRSR